MESFFSFAAYCFDSSTRSSCGSESHRFGLFSAGKQHELPWCALMTVLTCVCVSPLTFATWAISAEVKAPQCPDGDGVGLLLPCGGVEGDDDGLPGLDGSDGDGLGVVLGLGDWLGNGDWCTTSTTCSFGAGVGVGSTKIGWLGVGEICGTVLGETDDPDGDGLAELLVPGTTMSGVFPGVVTMNCEPPAAGCEGGLGAIALEPITTTLAVAAVVTPTRSVAATTVLVEVAAKVAGR